MYYFPNWISWYQKVVSLHLVHYHPYPRHTQIVPNWMNLKTQTSLSMICIQWTKWATKLKEDPLHLNDIIGKELCRVWLFYRGHILMAKPASLLIKTNTLNSRTSSLITYLELTRGEFRATNYCVSQHRLPVGGVHGDAHQGRSTRHPHPCGDSSRWLESQLIWEARARTLRPAASFVIIKWRR